LLDKNRAIWLSNNHVMGAVVTGEKARRVLFIYMNNVARNLGYHTIPAALMAPRERRNMTQALGRIIGHELIHAIAPPHPHSSEGLMESVLTRASLLKSKLMIDEECSDAFLAGLSEWSHRLE
jgi:hypothetical protein